MERSFSYKQGFIPYALAALLIGLVGGFSTVLGPAFVQDIGIAYIFLASVWEGNGTIFMKVVLSGLTPQEAGAGTGTYGLFRDLAAPFGVAVFVTMFTNQITSRIAAGTAEPAAAVISIHALAITEILCVALGILAVAFLPNRNITKEN